MRKKGKASFDKIPICLGWSRSPGSPGGLLTCAGCLGCPGRRGWFGCLVCPGGCSTCPRRFSINWTNKDIL